MLRTVDQRAQRPGERHVRLYRSASLAAAVIATVTSVACWPASGRAQEGGIFRLVTFSTGRDLRLGATRGDGGADIVDLHNAVKYLKLNQPETVSDLRYIPADMKTLIEVGDEPIRAVRDVYRTIIGLRTDGRFGEPGGDERVFYPPTSVELRPPIPNPAKVLGLAGNYPRSGDLARPEYPSAFFKSVAGLIGDGEDIDLHGLVTRGVHEPELAFVIGKKAKNVPEDRAFDYVVGYTIMNDVTGRDLASGKHPSQGSTLTKGIDTFAPCGPYLTLKEDVPDPHNLTIEARINGKPWQIPNANTRHLTFKIPQIIAYLSARMTLVPGDIITTGVPAPVVELKAGDTIEISIEGLGTLRNHVVSDKQDLGPTD